MVLVGGVRYSWSPQLAMSWDTGAPPHGGADDIVHHELLEMLVVLQVPLVLTLSQEGEVNLWHVQQAPDA